MRLSTIDSMIVQSMMEDASSDADSEVSVDLLDQTIDEGWEDVVST